MLKKYKNQLFDFIKETNYGIDKFHVEFLTDRTRVFYKNEHFVFVFIIMDSDHSFDKFTIEGTAFLKNFPIVSIESVSVNFPIVIRRLEQWMESQLSEFVTEYSGDDAWERYFTAKNSIDQGTSSDYANLTELDKQQIATSIKELQSQVIEEFELEADQKATFENRVVYLLEALERATNKTDYKGILFAAALTLGQELAFNPDKAERLFNLFIKAIQVLYLLPHSNI